MASNKVLIWRFSLITVSIFMFCFPFIVNSDSTSAEITFTKVGEIEPDSMFETPYIGYTTDQNECWTLTNKKTCHYSGGSLIDYQGRSVWKMPKNGANAEVTIWENNNLTVSNNITTDNPNSMQKMCLIAKDITRKTTKEHVTIYISGKIGDYEQTLVDGYIGNISKRRFTRKCFVYQLDYGQLTNVRIFIRSNQPNAIVYDKIELYQGGSGPSIIDEIAAHPFDTGTK